MAQKTLSFSLLILLAAATVSSAFNITSILEQYPDFSTFNTLLTQSGVAGEINSRSSITVLAVDNTVLRGFQDLPAKVIKIVLSVHIVLDYYDIPKIESIATPATILTTLFQTTGSAQDKQGFLNMTKTSGSKGQVIFGSTMPGSVSQANLMKSVVAKPYDVSILQVDSLIVPSIVGAPTPAPSESDGDVPATSNAPPANAKAPSTSVPATTAKAPAATTKAPSTNAPVVNNAKAPVSTNAPVVNHAKAPVNNLPSINAKAPTNNVPKAEGPATSVAAKAPVNNDVPATKAPVASVPVMEAPTANAPVADAPVATADAPVVAANAPALAADAPAPSKNQVKEADTLKSGAGKVAVSAGVGVAIMGSVLLGL